MFDGECTYCLVRAKGLMLPSVFTVCGLKHRNIKCNVSLSLSLFLQSTVVGILLTLARDVSRSWYTSVER